MSHTLTYEEITQWVKARCRESFHTEIVMKRRLKAGEVSNEAYLTVVRNEQCKRAAWRRMYQAIINPYDGDD